MERPPSPMLAVVDGGWPVPCRRAGVLLMSEMVAPTGLPWPKAPRIFYSFHVCLFRWQPDAPAATASTVA
ncbi:MAG: hypothetical protein ACR2LQ_07910 [Acidimicrobiales bacterium]